MEDILSKILAHKEKSLDEVAGLFEMTPRDILELLTKRERVSKVTAALPLEEIGPVQVSEALVDERTDDQLADYFLNRLQKESLSITALNNKYKVHDEERVERILENLVREGKLTKRESRNKRGRFVYEAS